MGILLKNKTKQKQLQADKQFYSQIREQKLLLPRKKKVIGNRLKEREEELEQEKKDYCMKGQLPRKNIKWGCCRDSWCSTVCSGPKFASLGISRPVTSPNYFGLYSMPRLKPWYPLSGFSNLLLDAEQESLCFPLQTKIIDPKSTPASSPKHAVMQHYKSC